MSLQVEKLEKNMAKLTIEASAEDFEKAIQKVYLKARGRINIPGFRKGKAPRKLIEKMYGTGVFYEDAANDLIPTAYAEALKDCDLEIVSRPEINVTQIESGKPFIFTAEVAVKPEVTLGEYKGVEVEKSDVEVTDEDINKEVDKERENNSRTIDVDDRAVESGDIIKLDFDGSVDGVPFAGGKAENYTLTIGSGSFIPGFEDQLIGTKIGEDKDVTVTFPEDYHEKSLAGKEAVFKCKVNAINGTGIQLHILGLPVDRGLHKLPAFQITDCLSQLQIKAGVLSVVSHVTVRRILRIKTYGKCFCLICKSNGSQKGSCHHSTKNRADHSFFHNYLSSFSILAIDHSTMLNQNLPLY